MKQEDGEALDSFHRRLRTAAPTCEFHNADFEVEQQIIVGGKSSSIRKKALKDPEYKLKDMLTDGRRKESSTLQAKEIERKSIKEEEIDKVTAKKRTQSTKCWHCGGNFPHFNEKCPAFQTKSNSRGSKRNSKVNKDVKRVQVHEENLSSSSSSDEDLCMLKFDTESRKVKPKTNVTIKGQKIKMTVDSGASINVIDEDTFSKLKGIELHKTDVKAYTYGGKQPVRFLGKFSATIETRKSIAAADIYVIKEKNCGCLLSCSTAQELRLISFDLDAIQSFAEKSIDTIKKDKDLDSILKRYEHLFKGLGKFKKSKVGFNIDPDVEPVVLKHRRVPFHIRTKVSQALKNLIKDDLIEKIPNGQPTPWVSPIVAVPQKDNSIRLCVDMRQPNLAIKRTRYPIPTPGDVDVLLNGSCYFSKLDIKQAFHQVELEEDSRYITTFATHKGLYRYKRLNFGTNVASEIFQNLLEEELRDIPGVKNLHDDILVFGKTRSEHDAALDKCLQRLSEAGLKLNKKKCRFLQEEVSFFGHVYSKDGIKPDPNRINDILNLDRPANIKELRSFLGMLNYCSKFIDDYSTITAPLRELTKKNSRFIWTDSHQSAYDLLKEKLTTAPLMSYFDITRETELCVDASPFGLSAILIQKDEHSNNHVIAYASRSLSQVEQKYCQTEREALAIVWGVEHFHQYLYGSLFTIVSDHKPLEVIYGKANSKPSARIERWVLRLQPYNFRIRYRDGKENPADYMSRHPSKTNRGDQEKYTELYINFITKCAIPSAMTRNEIISETDRDLMSGLLKKAISANNWDDQRLEKYRKLQKEFSITNDGIILRGSQIFIPHKLRNKAIEIAHESHQGLEKTKLALKEKVWFPKLDVMVADRLRTCIPCLATGKDVQPEPIRMTKMPNKPWEKLHLDFKGPLPGGKYLLVVIDRYSRYPEVEIITSTNIITVVRKLNKIFASHGIPEVLITDNGPPFNSKDFEQYMKELGVSHKFSTPYWPQGNAEVERFMRTLGKILKIANLTHDDIQNALSRFLFTYRNTPHCTTRVPPGELLYNRSMNGKIPSEKKEWVDRHHLARENDEKSRNYNKSYADSRRRTKENEIEVGDSVLIKQKMKNKLMTKFNPEPCVVVKVNGPEVTVRSKDGNLIRRNKSFMKKIPIIDSDSEDEEFLKSRDPEENDLIDEDSSNESEENEETNDIPRRSTRVTNPPERYGFPVPSEIIE